MDDCISFLCCTGNHEKYRVKPEDKNLPARSGKQLYSKNSKFLSDKYLKNPHTYWVAVFIWLLEPNNEAMDQFSSWYIPASVFAGKSSSLSLQSAECHVGHLLFLAVQSHGVHLNCTGSAWVSESYPMMEKKQKVSTCPCIHDFF